MLGKSIEGKALLKADKSKPLDSGTRLRLVRIIANSILKEHPEAVRSAVYTSCTHEIVRVFPQEKLSVYYHTKIVESTRGIISRLAGKLPDAIHNLKRKYTEQGIFEKRRRTSSPSSTSSNPSQSPRLRLPETLEATTWDEETLDNIQWLKNSSDPWATVAKKWSDTTHARLQLAKETPIAAYFNEYPALGKPLGYVLVSTF